MELMEIYNQIHNPIDDPRVIEKLINAYANLSKGFGGYYGQLTKTVQKEHNKGQYYREDADRFYAMLFNKWKNSIVAMTRDEFVQLYRKGSYGQDFIKMRNYLKNVPDVSTMKEADEIFYGNKGDKELESALDKYSWKSFGGGSGWIHVCSRYLTAKKDQYPNVEHRLYLDTESLDTYKMITYLVEKCDEHHLPYYFKFDQYANRDDTIVIYSSTENLTKYVEILQEIKKEHPDLVSRAKEPPVLTGQIDGWIGYGSEPSKTPDGKRQSFNEVRAKTLEHSIGTVTKQWIMSHRNQEITYQDQKLSFQDYVAMKSAEKLVADLEKRFLYYEEKDKKVAQRNGKTYNQLTVIDRLGYALQDVRSSQFKQSVYRILKDHMGTLLPRICNGSYKNMDTINMTVRNGKKITFSGDDLETIIQRLSVNIAKNDPNFIPTVQATIKKEASQYGIDSEKFCFDTKTREKMRTITAQKEAQRQQQVQQQPPVSNTPQQTVLTNGAADPNKYLGASGENYEVMKNKIKSLGSMKEILKNHDLVKSIIAYNGDRHFFTAFIDLVNEGLAKHEIWDDDLEVFTSGEVADAIVNIDQTARQYGNRQAYPNETLDKLNYLALITDSKAYAASFTHPEILQAMAGNGNRELREWSQSSHVPPVGGFAAVVYEMIEKGNIEEAKEFIDRIGYHSKKYSQAHKMQPTEEIKQENIQEEVMKQTVNVEDTKSVDLSSLDVQTLPQMINPALMERKMKLPNGAEIPAKQYIQEVVYPQLPKNGVVILDNGAVLPVKQFIEEGVMFECQEKYNGDFPKYMAERTRSNLGVVTVGNGDERYDLNPVEITEYINPALLDKRVKLPNGVEISARQYIQEVYAPHIPANGMVTLSNGAEIPVKQYIEEVLLWEGQEKYNGDIEQILYNTTRNNTGIVNADPKNLQEALIKMRTQTESIEQQQSVGGHGR